MKLRRSFWNMLYFIENIHIYFLEILNVELFKLRKMSFNITKQIGVLYLCCYTTSFIYFWRRFLKMKFLNIILFSSIKQGQSTFSNVCQRLIQIWYVYLKLIMLRKLDLIDDFLIIIVIKMFNMKKINKAYIILFIFISDTDVDNYFSCFLNANLSYLWSQFDRKENWNFKIEIYWP